MKSSHYLSRTEHNASQSFIGGRILCPLLVGGGYCAGQSDVSLFFPFLLTRRILNSRASSDANTVGSVASVASVDWGCTQQVMIAASIGSGAKFVPTNLQMLCVGWLLLPYLVFKSAFIAVASMRELFCPIWQYALLVQGFWHGYRGSTSFPISCMCSHLCSCILS